MLIVPGVLGKTLKRTKMAKSSYTDWYRFLDKSDECGTRIALHNIKTGAHLSCEIAPETSTCMSFVKLDDFCRMFAKGTEAYEFFLTVMKDLDNYEY